MKVSMSSSASLSWEWNKHTNLHSHQHLVFSLTLSHVTSDGGVTCSERSGSRSVSSSVFTHNEHFQHQTRRTAEEEERRSFAACSKFFFFVFWKTARFASRLARRQSLKLRPRWKKKKHVFILWSDFSKPCCESCELWFCPFFCRASVGLTLLRVKISATPRPVRCLYHNVYKTGSDFCCCLRTSKVLIIKLLIIIIIMVTIIIITVSSLRPWLFS